MALHEAVRNEDLSLAKRLITEGADVNQKDKMNRTPLHFACWKGNFEIVKLLVTAKSDLTSLAMDAFTPLHFASQSGNVQIVDLLLSKNPHLLNLKITKGNKTALNLSLNKDHVEVTEYLLLAGATHPPVNVMLSSSKSSEMTQMINEYFQIKDVKDVAPSELLQVPESSVSSSTSPIPTPSIPTKSIEESLPDSLLPPPPSIAPPEDEEREREDIDEETVGKRRRVSGKKKISLSHLDEDED